MRIGFHVMIGGGLERAVATALACRCQTLQVFAASPGQWKGRTMDEEENSRFVHLRQQHDLRPLFVHAPYLLNLATSDKVLREKSLTRLAADMTVAHAWQAEGVVLHLGSGGPEMPLRQAIKRVAAGLRHVRARTDGPTRLILENCAGQGQIVGDTAEELGEVIAEAGPERLGVCLDTAHALAAGHAVNERDGLDALLAQMDAAFGLERLALVHANDSQGALGSHRDRHQDIGQGFIGTRGWRVITSHPALTPLPFIMETPKNPATAVDDDLRNLKALRRLIPAELRPKLPRAR